MKDFKFLTEVDENDAIIPTNERFNELVDYQTRREVVFVPSETTQIYTEMIRMNIPLNEMTEDHLNQIKLNNEQKLIAQITDTLDFRHEVISVDGNGFTLRTELFI
jgi:hypothetical protein